MLNERGYQLPELMLVCLLIGLFFVTGLAWLESVGHQEKLHSAGQLFVSSLAEARSLSISVNAPVQVAVHPEGDRFTFVLMGGEPFFWRQLPGKVRFTHFPAARVTFYSRGTTAPAGSFEIANPAGRIRIIVSVAGRVRWERVE